MRPSQKEKRMTAQNQYRADHVGSFLRPAELLDARTSNIAPEELHALEDKHILRILEKQKDLGLEVFTDGELRRSNFMSDFTDAVEGFDLGDAVPRHWDDAAKQAAREQSTQTKAVSSITGIVNARLQQRFPLTGRELPFLKQHSPGPIKMTLPSATQFPAISFKYGVTDAVYPDPYALLTDITDIMTADLRHLHAFIHIHFHHPTGDLRGDRCQASGDHITRGIENGRATGSRWCADHHHIHRDRRMAPRAHPPHQQRHEYQKRPTPSAQSTPARVAADDAERASLKGRERVLIERHNNSQSITSKDKHVTIGACIHRHWSILALI